MLRIWFLGTYLGQTVDARGDIYAIRGRSERAMIFNLLERIYPSLTSHICLTHILTS